MTQILMPALSPTMEEGKLAKWHVKEGDTVKTGDILAEIETDKATMEFESIDEGRIANCSSPKAPRASRSMLRSRSSPGWRGGARTGSRAKAGTGTGSKNFLSPRGSG